MRTYLDLRETIPKLPFKPSTYLQPLLIKYRKVWGWYKHYTKYAISCKKAHFSRNKISCQLSETFMNIEAKQHMNHHLTHIMELP